MIRSLLVLSTLLAAAAPATAQVVPAAETPGEAAARIEFALSAIDEKATSPLIRQFNNWGDRVVIDINAGSEREPITAAIRATHSALVRAERKGALPAEIIVTFAWAGLIMGPQFVRLTPSNDTLATMTAEQWFSTMSYSGSSEKGLIGLVSWCRRGGSTQVPRICSDVREKAIERNVWNAVRG
jgi:hypothetical protein